jgi:hypothetical protein
VAQPIFVKIKTQPELSKEVVKKFGLLLQFSKKLPKENSRLLGENSPNLVTLLRTI